MRQYLSSCALLILALGCGPRKVGVPQQPQPISGDETQAANDRVVAEILEGIVGREQDSAGIVFKNVHFLAGVPAQTFLTIMNEGYAKALGVRCSHCHVVGNFASDSKRPKRAAREMQQMHRMINQQLQQMQYLATPITQNRAINCITCHRGQIDPR